MTSNPDKPQRDARGLWAAGNSGNPSGRPKKVAEIEALAQEHSPQAFRKILELLDHRDGRVQLQAATTILAYAYGKPTERVKAEVRTLDIGQLYLKVLQEANAPKPIIEGEAVQPTQIINGMATPIVEAKAVAPARLPAQSEGPDRLQPGPEKFERR